MNEGSDLAMCILLYFNAWMLVYCKGDRHKDVNHYYPGAGIVM